MDDYQDEREDPYNQDFSIDQENIEESLQIRDLENFHITGYPRKVPGIPGVRERYHPRSLDDLDLNQEEQKNVYTS